MIRYPEWLISIAEAGDLHRGFLADQYETLLSTSLPPNGSPNSSGMIAEVAYVPWGKPGSFISWGNVRLAVQYVSYFRFDGVTNNAAASNALYFSVWAAAHF